MQIKKKMILIPFFVFSCYVFDSYGLLSFTYPHEAFAIVERYLPSHPVIIEAGAFDGVDSVRMAKKWPQSTIHSFEPIPYLYSVLVNTTKNQANVYTYSLAVGDFIGNATMYVSEEPNKPGIPSQSSSLLEPKEHLTYSNVLFKQEITVPVTTFDVWAEQNNVDHVDFMWLDMQGYELNALMASPKILSTVRIISTEVEFVEAYANQYQFEEVKQWLEEQGFEMIAKKNAFGWYGEAIFVRKEYLS